MEPKIQGGGNRLHGDYVFRVLSYLIIIGCFLVLPLLMTWAYRRLLWRYWNIRPERILYATIAVQIVLVILLSFQPIITYDSRISNEDIQNHGAWGRTILEHPFAGFYSPNLPLLAYRFHIVDLHINYVVAEIHYFPAGKTEVKWDETYEITSPLTGL